MTVHSPVLQVPAATIPSPWPPQPQALLVPVQAHRAGDLQAFSAVATPTHSMPYRTVHPSLHAFHALALACPSASTVLPAFSSWQPPALISKSPSCVSSSGGLFFKLSSSLLAAQSPLTLGISFVPELISCCTSKTNAFHLHASELWTP